MTARIPVLTETKRMTGMAISLGTITAGQRSWMALLALQQQNMVFSFYFNSLERHLLVCFCLSSGFVYADSANKIDFGNNGKTGVIFLSSLSDSLAWCWHLLEQLLLGTEDVLLSLWGFFCPRLYQVNYLPRSLPWSSPKLMGARTENNTHVHFWLLRELFLWPITQRDPWNCFTGFIISALALLKQKWGSNCLKILSEMFGFKTFLKHLFLVHSLWPL